MGSAPLVTTEQAALILGVKAGTIAKWKHRHKVTPAGILHGRGRGGGVPLYHLEELRPLAQQYHRRLATRRANAGGGPSMPT